MQNVSRVSGEPIPVTIKGRELLLKEMTIENLGAFQAEAVRQKRRRYIEATMMAKELLPANEGRELLKEAIAESAEMLNLTDQEASEFLNSVDGATYFLWVLIDSQYPGIASRADVLELLNSDAFGEKEIAFLVGKLFGNNSGNEIGQSKEAVSVA